VITSASQLVYSLSAARRITGLPVQQLRIFSNAVWIQAEGDRPTFLSKKTFKRHFADWRRSRARALTVTSRIDGGFTVRNETKGTTYLIDCRVDGVFCNCDDFNNQLEFLGHGCCKHGYAVLAYLGCGSLTEYLAAMDDHRGTGRVAA